MPTLETIATRFARCVDLFRDVSAKEDQKAEFRALLDLLKQTRVTLTADAGRLEVNGLPCEGPAFAVLLQRLELHGVGEVALPPDPRPSDLFELLRALADQPGEGDIPARLRAAGVEGIAVTMAAVAPPARPPGSAWPPERFAVADPMAPGGGGASARSLGTDGILRGDAMGDVRSVPVAGVPLVTHDPPPPPPSVALPGPDVPPHPHQAAAPDRPPAARPAGEASVAPVAPASQSGDDPLAELERQPEVAAAGDLLAALVRRVEEAMQSQRIERAMRIVATVVRCEQQVSDGDLRRHYGIALRRMYSKPLLDGLAHLVTAPGHHAEASLALQRAGARGVTVLLHLLIAARSMPERQSLFAALTEMKEGTEQLVHMLDHHQWFVVRNVAELVGELGLEEAVPELARQLDHDDERVRRAVALALAKIGTRGAAEPLRRALRDPSPQVRIQVALGVGGRKSNALAMPLVVAMEEEENEEVERELILALGRIGSPDAVQALIKFAQPAGRLFGRKPAALRLAAVEALRIAATPAAVGTLQGLAEDGDKQVRAAAQAALKDLKR